MTTISLEIKELSLKLNNLNLSLNTKDLTLEEINNRIMLEYDSEIDNNLSDLNLLDQYKNSKSFKKNIKLFTNILEDNLSIIEDSNLRKQIQNNIIKDYTINLIPAGAKAVIRGLKFNNIIKNKIDIICKKYNNLSYDFEKNPLLNNNYLEIPDWYIKCNKTNKTILGFNQIDLWSGGAQTNRAFKYINSNIQNQLNDVNDFKIVCVVSKFIKIKSNKNKIYKLFNIGFKQNSISYTKNLENIIINYLALSS